MGFSKPKMAANAAEPMDVEPPSPVDQLAADFYGPSELRECLEGWAATLPVPVTDFRFELGMDQQRVYRVRVNNGLSAPQCARDLLLGRTYTVDPAALVFHVQIPQE